MNRRAFSLVELVIVCAVLGLLIGILLPVVNMLRERGRVTATELRIRNLNEAFLGLQHGASDAALALQTAAGMPGVRNLGPKPSIEYFAPAGSWYPANERSSLLKEVAGGGAFLTQGELDLPYIFGFPWGQKDMIRMRTVGDPPSTTETSPLAAGYQTTHLGQLNPDASAELIAASRIDAGEDPAEFMQRYRTVRSRSSPFNDAWGNPLIVAWGLYQPGGAAYRFGTAAWSASFVIRYDSLRFTRALQAYGYTRSVYLAIGSAGPQLPDGMEASMQHADADAAVWRSTILPALWSQITTVCRAQEWTGASFVTPPWNGVRSVSTPGGRCLLSAPCEIRSP